MIDEESIREIKKRHEAQLLSFKGVVGVGIGIEVVDDKKQLAIVVDVDKKLEEHDHIPKSLDGVPVVVQEVGRIKALQGFLYGFL